MHRLSKLGAKATDSSSKYAAEADSSKFAVSADSSPPRDGAQRGSAISISIASVDSQAKGVTKEETRASYQK